MPDVIFVSSKTVLLSLKVIPFTFGDNGTPQKQNLTMKEVKNQYVYRGKENYCQSRKAD